jgi:tetratricopeptide (TPR) repeat protein
LIYLAQIYAKQLKKPDLAQKYAEQALALAPDDFQVHNALYEIQIAAGQPKKAEEILDRASKSKSADPHFWIQLGDLSTRLYFKEDGSSEPAQVQRMNAIYQKAGELGKDDPAALAKIGDYFVLSRPGPRGDSVLPECASLAPCNGRTGPCQPARKAGSRLSRHRTERSRDRSSRDSRTRIADAF